jgi:hypothetical protein
MISLGVLAVVSVTTAAGLTVLPRTRTCTWMDR